MLLQSKQNLKSYINREVIRIRNKELELYHNSLTERGIGLISALIAELAFEALIKGSFRQWSFAARNPTIHHDEEYHHTYDWTQEQKILHNRLHRSMAVVLFISFTAAINSVVVCGAALVFGPSLALRGLELEDMERAVTGMLYERRTAFRLAIFATMTLLAASIPAVMMRLNTTRYQLSEEAEASDHPKIDKMAVPGIWTISSIPIISVLAIIYFAIGRVQKRFKLD